MKNTTIITVALLLTSLAAGLRAESVNFDYGIDLKTIAAKISTAEVIMPETKAAPKGSLLREVIPGVWVQPLNTLPDNKNLAAIYKEFTKIISVAFDQSDWQGEYNGATCGVLKATKTAELSEKDLAAIARKDFGADSLGENPLPVKLMPLANSADNMAVAKKYACTSGLVNEYCSDFESMLRKTMAQEPQIRLFVGTTKDGNSSKGFVIFYDLQAKEVFTIGSGYLYNM